MKSNQVVLLQSAKVERESLPFQLGEVIFHEDSPMGSLRGFSPIVCAVPVVGCWGVILKRVDGLWGFPTGFATKKLPTVGDAITDVVKSLGPDIGTRDMLPVAKIQCPGDAKVGTRLFIAVAVEAVSLREGASIICPIEDRVCLSTWDEIMRHIAHQGDAYVEAARGFLTGLHKMSRLRMVM